jgi:hypothetical protein
MTGQNLDRWASVDRRQTAPKRAKMAISRTRISNLLYLYFSVFGRHHANNPGSRAALGGSIIAEPAGIGRLLPTLVWTADLVS